MRLLCERSCTDTENRWLPPHIKKVNARPVVDMDFSSANMKRRCLLESNRLNTTCDKMRTTLDIPAPTATVWNIFFDALIESGLKPAVAATDPRYSHLYVPAAQGRDASYLDTLYKKEFELLS